MKKKLVIIVAIVMAGGLATTVFGSTVVLGPSDALNGPLSNGSAPIDTTSSQAAIGSGSWQANGTAQSQYYLYYNGSSSTEQGLGQLTVNGLSSLSFETFETAAEENAGDPSANWYLTIYTTPHSGGEASWYGNRLVMEPYLANSYTPALNQWVTWSTASGPNQLTINDTGGASGNTGFYGQPTLTTIQGGPITWNALTAGGSSTPIDYGNMDILGIVLSTGSPWDVGFTGLVDNVNINSTGGNVQFDLEATAVPEPTTIIAGALLLLPFGMGTLRMFRKNRLA